MKIAFIGSRGFPGIPAGVEKSLEELCPRLAARGHEVVLYCSDKVTTKDAVYKGVVLKRTPAVPSKHLETFSRVFMSATDALARDYDIVHFHSIGPALLSWTTRFKAPTVVTVHGLDWQRAKWGAVAREALKIGEKSAIWFPHKTVVVSKALQRYYREQHGREVIYIPNGVNIEPPLPPRLIREKWGLKTGKYVLFASRLVPEKACHTLIEAFGRVKTDLRLVIAGASWYSDAYVAQLKKSAENDPRVLFAGWAEGELLKELFSNAYLYCLPSEIEGLSLSLLEGMGYGVCPVVSDIPENTDVTGNVAGVSFRKGDAQDLAQKLQRLADDPNEARERGKAAYEAVRNEYSWDKSALQLEEVYKSIARRRARLATPSALETVRSS